MNHSILAFNSDQWILQREAFQLFYNASSTSSKLITISIIGNSSISKHLIDCLTKPTSKHSFQSIKNHVCLYLFPFFDVHVDLAIFDFTSIPADLMMQHQLLQRTWNALSSIVILCIPYSSEVEDYQQSLSQISCCSTLILHYNVPVAECAWSFKNCTEQFLNRTHFSSSCDLLVVDIPTSVLEKSTSHFSVSSEGLTSRLLKELKRVNVLLPLAESTFHNPVYMEQSRLALMQLIHSQTPSLTSRAFAGEFYYIIRLLNENGNLSSKSIHLLCRQCSTIPSSTIRSLFQTLWINLYPPPFISLYHAPFGDDFYIRFQERISLTESILLVLLANQLRQCFVKILSEKELIQLLKDYYKVIHAEIIQILPCMGKLRVDRGSEITKIDGSPEKYGDISYLPCIVSSGLHTVHQSVVPVSYRDWKGINVHKIYSWKGDFKNSSVHDLDKEAFLEEMEMLLSFHRMSTEMIHRMFLHRQSTSRQALFFDQPIHEDELTRVVPFCWVCGFFLPNLVMKNRGSERERFHVMRVNEQPKKEEWVREKIMFVRCDKCKEMKQSDSTHLHPLPCYLAIDGVPSLLLSSVNKTQWCPLCSHLLVYFNQEGQTSPRSPSLDDSAKRVLELRNYMSLKLDEIQKRKESNKS